MGAAGGWRLVEGDVGGEVLGRHVLLVLLVLLGTHTRHVQLVTGGQLGGC
jgi:hypothetical protein